MTATCAQQKTHQNGRIVALSEIFGLQRIDFSKASFCHNAKY
jgi:hypothetical protein